MKRKKHIWQYNNLSFEILLLLNSNSMMITGVLDISAMITTQNISVVL